MCATNATNVAPRELPMLSRLARSKAIMLQVANHPEQPTTSILSLPILGKLRQAHEKLFASPSLLLGLSQAFNPVGPVRRHGGGTVEPQSGCHLSGTAHPERGKKSSRVDSKRNQARRKEN